MADPKTSTATASFTITEVNDAPTGVNDTRPMSPRTRIGHDPSTLLANDSKGPANESGQNLTITAVRQAVGGSGRHSGTNVIFTPTADYNGPASYRIHDQDDGTTNGVADPQDQHGHGQLHNHRGQRRARPRVNDIGHRRRRHARSRSIDVLANDSKGPANESGQTLTVTAVDPVPSTARSPSPARP